ncbi:MAG: phosphatidyl-myo-inositol alpha-mannosyltransferase [Actinomycetota bacterium]
MRIALLSPYVWPEVRRGGERYLDDLAWYLRGAGHTVDVITGTALRPGVTRVDGGDDVRLKNIRGLSRGGVHVTAVETFAARVLPTLARRRYDIVHSLAPAAALTARLCRQRTAFTFLGHPTPAWLAEHPTKRRVARAVVRTCDAMSALSPAVADDIENAFGRRPAVIAPGVRTANFAPAPRTAEPTILFASAMRPEKGLDVLLRAFVTVAAVDAGVRLVLCGPGDATWAFDAVGAAIDPCRDRIDVLPAGAPEDLPARYARAHVTVLPSRNEAFGLALAESLASGTPVVGCTGGGAEEIVTPGVGAIVAHGDAPALAHAIQRVLALAAEPSTVAACLERAALWDWKASIGPQHEAMYKGVIGHG